MLRTGQPGSGKTWSLVRYLVEEFLPDHAGRIYTNLPLNIEAICEYVAKGDQLKAESIRARIVLFPEEHVQAWLDGVGTPEDYFKQLEAEELEAAGLVPGQGREATELGIGPPLKGALLVIDEAGKMWPNTMEDPSRKINTSKLAKWLRTLRHDGAKCIFVIQDGLQLSATVRRLVAVELCCYNLASRREMVTGALVSDWLQVKALFTGTYVTWIQEQELVKEGDSMTVEHTYARPMTTRYFKFYNSHNRDDGSTGGEEEWEYQRFGVARFFFWLVKRNAFNWGIRLAGFAVLWSLLGPPFYGAWKGISWMRTEGSRIIAESQLKTKGGAAGGSGPGAALPGPGVPSVTVSAGGVPATVVPELDRLAAELRAERALRSELEQRLGASSSLVLVDEKGCLTDEGEYWHVGKSIEVGKFAGERVVSADVPGRRVVLGNGVTLRLRRFADGLAPDDGKGRPPVSELAGKLPPGGAVPGDGKASSGGAGLGAPAPDVQRAGRPGGGPGRTPGEANPAVNRGRSNATGPAGNAGPETANAGGGSADRR